MDSQHRHDLQDNWLAHRLESGIEAAKPHLPLIIGGLLAFVAAFWGLGLLRSSSDSARYAAWDGYAIAMEGGQPNPALLERVADDQAGSPAAEWASITLADSQLYVAAQSYLTSRESANASLETAKQRYQQLRGSGDARVRGRAVFGLARVAELEGDLEGAAKLYGQVKGAFADVAAERAEELATDRVKDDYAWLASAGPAIRRPPAGAGVPGLVPDFAADTIDTPSETEEATEDAEQPSAEETIEEMLKEIDAEEAAEASAEEAAGESTEPATTATDDAGEGE